MQQQIFMTRYVLISTAGLGQPREALDHATNA